MSERAALRFEGVTKRYRGGLGRRGALALDGLSFRIPTGSTCAFVGPNGAGKTTAFSVIGGFLRPDHGEVDILGRGPFDPWRMKGVLGVLPQDAELSLQHTAWELLVHLARLQGSRTAAARREASRVLEQVNLADRAHHRIGSLSHGMRRRIAVASALLGEPELVLLDEPTAGLDPVEAHALREVLSAAHGARTLVIASHHLLELEQLCDHVVLLSNGRCVRQGPMSELTGRMRRVEWRLGPGEVPLDHLQAALPEHLWSLDGDLLIQELPAHADADASAIEVMRLLAAAQVAVRELRRGQSLERSFIDETSRTRATS